MESCTIWDGAKTKKGYGVTWHNGKWAYAHRVAAGAKKGDVVLHICDNPSCVNPEHLRIGTYQDNSDDMVEKGRQARGETAGNSKYTEEIILAVRQYQGTLSSRKTAALFGMSKTNVLHIWKRNIWRHV